MLVLLATACACGRVFLLGGAINASNSEIYNALAKSVSGRTPSPNKCTQDWATTSCPRIAVVTSAAASQADGDYVYITDEPNSPSYFTMFNGYGFSPMHVSAHIDNYLQHTDQGTAEGRRNY